MEVKYGPIERMPGSRLFQRDYTAIAPSGERSLVTLELEWVAPADDWLRGIARLVHQGGRHEVTMQDGEEWGFVLRGTFFLRTYLVRWAHDENLRIVYGDLLDEEGEIEDSKYLHLSTEPLLES